MWTPLCGAREKVFQNCSSNNNMCRSSCGAPGYIRVAFANLEQDVCREAAARLRRGLEQLCSQGMSAVLQAPLGGIESVPADVIGTAS